MISHNFSQKFLLRLRLTITILFNIKNLKDNKLKKPFLRHSNYFKIQNWLNTKAISAFHGRRYIHNLQ